MGFHDAALACGMALVATLGQTVTYAPVGEESFSCVAIRGRSDRDASFRQDVVDTTTWRILQSALSAAGVTAPTCRRGQVLGDTITAVGLTGESETWVVTDANPDKQTGMWLLTVARNERARS